MERKKKPELPSIRLLGCGSRTWQLVKHARKIIRRELEALVQKKKIEFAIEGGADGADTMFREECWRLRIPVVTCFANWVYLGRAAGPIRNRFMQVKFQPDYVLAFHPDIDESRGTKDMLKAAKKARVKYKLVGAGFVEKKAKVAP